MKWIDSLEKQARRLKLELHALWLAGADPRTPRMARWLIVCIIVYAVSPIDLIPDPIPILGYLDDLILLPLGIALALRMIPGDVMAGCRERARTSTFSAPSHWKWAGVALVALVWVSAIGLVAWLVRRCMN